MYMHVHVHIHVYKGVHCMYDELYGMHGYMYPCHQGGPKRHRISGTCTLQSCDPTNLITAHYIGCMFMYIYMYVYAC